MQSAAVDDILNPIERERFVSDYLGKRFLHIKGRADRLAGLIGWAELNRVLQAQAFEPTQVSMARQGEWMSPNTYVSKEEDRFGVRALSPVQLSQQLREGATLIINQVERLHSPVLRLVDEIARNFSCRASANLYASFCDSPGFDLHWDSHDAIILQLTGKKQWEVYNPTRLHPLEGERARVDIPRPTGAPIWKDVLANGDVLYLPRGWWHAVTPCNEPTIHLTIGLYYMRGLDVLKALMDDLRAYPNVRMDVPSYGSPDVRREYFAGLQASAMEALGDPQLVDKLIRFERSSSDPGLPLFELPMSVSAQELLQCYDSIVTLLPELPLVIESVDGQGALSLTYKGTSYVFAAGAERLLTGLGNGGSMSLGSFYDRFKELFDREELETFVMDLVAQGLANLSSPSTEAVAL